MNEMICYGDVVQLTSNARAGSALRVMSPIDTSAGRLSPVYAAKRAESEAKSAAWRILPFDPPLGRLGAPVLFGEPVRLQSLGPGAAAGDLRVSSNPSDRAPAPGAKPVHSQPGASTSHAAWVFSLPADSGANGPVLAGATIQLTNPQTKLHLYTNTHALSDGIVVMASSAPLTFGWTITVRNELAGLTSREDVSNLAIDPLGVYEQFAPVALDAAQGWLAAGRDPAKEFAAKRDLNEQLEKQLHMLPSWSRGAVNELVITLWQDAQAVVEAEAVGDHSASSGAKDALYGNLLRNIAQMSRTRLDKDQRQAAFEKFANLLGPNHADAALLRQTVAPWLEDELPDFGPPPRLPVHTLQRRDTGSGSPVTIPAAQPMPLWLDIAIGFLSFANSCVGTALNVSRGIAAAAGITIGIGQEYSAGAGGGGSLGAGLCVYPSGRLGFYGSLSGAAGAIFSLSMTWQWTFVHGGINDFRGDATVYSVGGGEVVVINGGTLHRIPSGEIFGGTAGFGLGVGSPIEFYVSYVHTGVARR